jgi:hypothetical protein
MGCTTEGVFWWIIFVVARCAESMITSQVKQTWWPLFVFGQGPKECNEVTSLATRENAEGDLIKPPRLA